VQPKSARVLAEKQDDNNNSNGVILLSDLWQHIGRNSNFRQQGTPLS